MNKVKSNIAILPIKNNPNGHSVLLKILSDKLDKQNSIAIKFNKLYIVNFILISLSVLSLLFLGEYKLELFKDLYFVGLSILLSINAIGSYFLMKIEDIEKNIRSFIYNFNQFGENIYYSYIEEGYEIYTLNLINNRIAIIIPTKNDIKLVNRIISIMQEDIDERKVTAAYKSIR